MKFNRKTIFVVFAALGLSVGFGSCTDQIKFGDSFLEKTPGGSVTQDTVFNSEEYALQFLTGIYSLQYYGLTYFSGSNSSGPNWASGNASYWTGNCEAASDCWQLMFAKSAIYKNVYSGSLTANDVANVLSYDKNNFWELIHYAWTYIENVDRVPDMSDSVKTRTTAEAKCLIASSYFQLFRAYGGLPIIDHNIAVNDASTAIPRSSVATTVKFIVKLLDEAINTSTFPWQWSSDEAATMTGRWTKAAAMALKCKVLQFAASPLFNSDKPYYSGNYTMDADSLVWYGNYSKDRWTAARKACDEFFAQLAANGGYSLVEPTEKTQEAYRYAYRSAYFNRNSSEILLSVRAMASKDSRNYWQYLCNNERESFNATQEYVEMFPWSDGTPFNWDESAALPDTSAKSLQHMFIKGDTVAGYQQLQNRTYTRDPRLYETVEVNGDLYTANISNGKMSGANCEMWVGGTLAGTAPKTQSGVYGTSYRHNKYVVDQNFSAYLRQYYQWAQIRLSDIYLTYAEALVQADDNYTKALQYVDAIRARVGLKGLAECNPSENLTSNKENLINEILRERACELGFENSRYWDLVRYKRTDIFSKKLHMLQIYRLVKNSSGKWERSESKWYDADRKTAKEGEAGYNEPSYFDFERVEISTGARDWWNGYDVKWLLMPFPIAEINKGYMVQNPGW
ncbi:MAG: RagB/SusD family nutrient uptake outer membrane protein [Prevotella sp.]|jgi:hypothetical protein